MNRLIKTKKCTIISYFTEQRRRKYKYVLYFSYLSRKAEYEHIRGPQSKERERRRIAVHNFR